MNLPKEIKIENKCRGVRIIPDMMEVEAGLAADTSHHANLKRVLILERQKPKRLYTASFKVIKSIERCEGSS